MPSTTAQYKPVVTINSLDDMNKILVLQGIITKQAHDMLQAIADKFPTPDADASEEVKYSMEILREERRLLHSYLERPTLTDFITNPQLYGAYMWGGTFGVTTLMNEIILQHIHSPSIKLASINRYLMVRLLQEIMEGNSQDSKMLGRIIASVNLSIPRAKSEADRVRIAYEMLAPVLEGMILLASEYGLLESQASHYTLTLHGKKALLHLIDAHRYINDVNTAHKRFQKDIPTQKVTAPVD